MDRWDGCIPDLLVLSCLVISIITGEGGREGNMCYAVACLLKVPSPLL
jgi:hypothetical protein